MRWIGVDPGGARVGITICDEHERVAVPVEIVPASVAVPAIRTIAQREGAGGIVIWLPVSLDGTERAAAAVLKGRKIVVKGWVSPGSTSIKRQAEAEERLVP